MILIWLTIQTVYAKKSGSIAAPTAGLHFSNELMTSIERNGIDIDYLTLHIGLGTFLPIKENDIYKHAIAPKFGLNDRISDEVKYVDKVMCVTEAYHLLQDYSWIYDDYWPKMNNDITIMERHWKVDMKEFLNAFYQYSE